MVKVLYFGVAREITRQAEEVLEVSDTGSLKRLINTTYPEMCSVPFRLALNGALLKEEAALAGGDTVAVLPPFAGG